MVTYVETDNRGQAKTSLLAELPKLQPFPTGSYNLIAIDPPWQYGLRESDKTHRNRTPYPNMTDKDILALPVGDIAAKGSYIFLWVTNNHLPLAFRCLEAWGFDYKTLYTWVKLTNDMSKPRIGVGHYGRACTEHFLIGTKGKPSSFTHLGLTNIPNIIQSPRREHSQKPEEFYAICDLLHSKIGGDRIELFARSRREDWSAWGLEA
jgi:N6-adenosine-specific RNA methylase IME4